MTQASMTGRGPKGWDRMVAQINASPDVETFHRGMLDLQCKIVAAEYGALWVMGPDGKPMAAEAWPVKLAQAPSDAPLMNLLSQAAKSGFERQASHILKAEPESAPAGADLGAHVFITVMRVKGQPTAVTTVVGECRDAQVLQSTAPLRELAAGLYDGFFARIEAQRRENDTARVRQAMAILAVSQEAEGFGGAALNLVNELARQLKCLRVSLGWLKGRSVKLVAMSDTEHIKRHSEDVAMIELAMAECLDQQQPVAYPIPPNAEPLLQQAVVHAHKKLIGGNVGRYALSLPLRQRDEWVGVLLVERTDTPFDAGLIQYTQLIADIVAPHLDDRRDADQMLPVHAWRSVEWAGAYLIGPKHIAWKLGAIAIIAVILFCVFGTWEYKVSAPFVFEAQSRRIIPAPFEAQLKSVAKRPGDHVAKGEVLATLDVTDLTMQRYESLSKLKMAKVEYNQYAFSPESKQAEAQQAAANVEKEQAHVDLLEYQLKQAVICSPVDGVVLSGNWYDKVGGVLKQGEQLFEVAPLNDLVALVHVSDADINQVTSDVKQGQLATRSEPEERFDFVVDRIVPAAMPVNGVNSFEVRVKLTKPADWLRPGMEGLAKLEIKKKPIWWILTHRVSDTLRMWIWL